MVKPLAETERQEILNAVRESGGNVLKAAIALQISKVTLYRKLKEYRASYERSPETRRRDKVGH